MAEKTGRCLLDFMLCLLLFVSFSGAAPARDQDLKPEDVVASHLRSIGDPQALAAIKNRGMSGRTLVDFLQGGTGKLSGQCVIVSAGPSLGIILKYGGLEYPGEYFAYDGKDVTVANISPGQRSPLADFIFRYKGLMKEGLLGGVLSLGWPLLDLEHKQPVIKYDQARIDNCNCHALEYYPKEGSNAIKIKLFFDPETFRHVRTEYRLKVRGEQALQEGVVLTRGATSSPVTRNAGVQDSMADSIYLLVEKFDNFKKVQGLMLPHTYTIEYSVQGQGSSFLGHWTLQADQWIHNGKIDSSFFKVH